MTETVRSALRRFHSQNRLTSQEANRPIWLATLGTLIIPLPNFRWRREVIDRHDAHHLITGHTTSVEGELSLASWELGVRCYEHWAAHTLCRLLMFIGLVRCPRKVLKSYRTGVKQRRIYASVKNEILEMKVQRIQSLFHKDLSTLS